MDFGSHTRNTLWILLSQFIGRWSLVTLLKNKGDTHPFSWRYTSAGLFEEASIFPTCLPDNEAIAFFRVEVLDSSKATTFVGDGQVGNTGFLADFLRRIAFFGG